MKTNNFSIYLFIFIILLPLFILIIKLNNKKSELFKSSEINIEDNRDIDINNNVTTENDIKVLDILNTDKFCIDDICLSEAELELIITRKGGFDDFIKQITCVKNTKDTKSEIECIPPSKLHYFKNYWPQGAIISFKGKKEDIPQGWSICDGTNGTPDLSDRFVLGHFDIKDNGLHGNYIKPPDLNNYIEKTDISKVKNLHKASWYGCKFINGPCPSFCGEGGNCRKDWTYGWFWKNIMTEQQNKDCRKYNFDNVPSNGHYCVPLKDKDTFTFEECRQKAINQTKTYFGITHLEAHPKNEGFCYLLDDDKGLIQNSNQDIKVLKDTKNRSIGNSNIMSIYNTEEATEDETLDNSQDKTETKTYKQGPCNPGYYDKTNGKYKWWACGKNCKGGKFFTDTGCNCACEKIPVKENNKGGEYEHTIDITEIPKHTHRFFSNNGGSGPGDSTGIASFKSNSTNPISANNILQPTGDNVPFNRMPPYYTLYYIMRTDTDSIFQESKIFDESIKIDKDQILRNQLLSYGYKPNA